MIMFIPIRHTIIGKVNTKKSISLNTERMKENKEITNPTRSCITYELESKKYATEVTSICEIIRMKPLTRSENMPAFMSGTLNLRGNMIPVVNTRAKLGMPEKEIDHETSIIIFQIEKENQKIKLGAMIDRVDAILDLSINKIMINLIDQSETLHHNEQIITLLNPGQLLSPMEADELVACAKN